MGLATKPILNVKLFTSKGCHSCKLFRKKYTELENEFPSVKFEKYIMQEGHMKLFKNNNVRTVPLLIFSEGGEEISRLSGTKKMYSKIDNQLMSMTDENRFDGELEKIQVCESGDKECKIKNIHKIAARLCRDVYDDKYLRSCEKFIEFLPTDSQCSFTVENDTIFVSFRGSDSIKDWKNNFTCSLVEYPKGSGRTVHAGFVMQWFSIRDDFNRKLECVMKDNKGKYDSIVFCGHSAGVISTLASLDFVENNKTSDVDVSSITFGAPRIGNNQFKKYFEDNVKCTRVVFDNDIITKTPFWGGYKHVGSTVNLRDSGVKYGISSWCETLGSVACDILKNREIGVKDHDISRYYDYIKGFLSK